MTDAAGSHCARCGAAAAGDHRACAAAAEYEPPRYCERCGRRMQVQVDPMGWRATCSEHGQVSG